MQCQPLINSKTPKRNLFPVTLSLQFCRGHSYVVTRGAVRFENQLSIASTILSIFARKREILFTDERRSTILLRCVAQYVP